MLGNAFNTAGNYADKKRVSKVDENKTVDSRNHLGFVENRDIAFCTLGCVFKCKKTNRSCYFTKPGPAKKLKVLIWLVKN